MTEIGAINALNTRRPMPRDGGGQPAVSVTIAVLKTLQVQRLHCIRSQSRCDRSIDSMLARALGYTPDMPEKERKRIFAAAATWRTQVEKGGEGHWHSDPHGRDALAAYVNLALASAQSRAVWDVLREDTENRMRELAATLPVWPWCKAVRGLGELGLAIIVAEIGPGWHGNGIGDFATKERIWKRLGLAVIGGRRQRKVSGAAAAEHGYSDRRRAEIWTLLSSSLFFKQWGSGVRRTKAEKAANLEKPPPRALGPYGVAYARRKAHTLPRIAATAHLPDKAGDYAHPDKWTKGRCENDARRVMSKLLLEDLWREWRRVTPLDIANG